MDTKTLFRWHGWLGLNVGVLLFVVCLSGTVAVFSYEIDWLIDPALQAEADTVNWTAMEDSVAAAYPGHVLTFIAGPRHDGFAALGYATDPSGRSVKLWLHPETGTVQKRGSFWTVQRFFRSFHRRMFVPNPFGILWITLFAFGLGASAVTGILFYKGWYRHLLRLRWRDVRLLFSDGHRLVGVWTLPFAAIIVATGIWYGLELVAPAPGPDPPGIPESELVARGPTPDLLPLGEQVARAQAAFPGLQPQDVIPGTAKRPTRVRGHADAWLVRPRANTVRIDPVTGEVLSVQKATEATAYHRWSDMADPLHFGTFGGWASQTLWFGLGLLMSSLMLTGGWLWHLRAEKKAHAAGADRHPRWGYAAAAVPVVALLVSGLFGVLEVRQNYHVPDAPRQMTTTQHAVGPWQARLVRLHDPRDGVAPIYRVAFAGPAGRAANVKAATLHGAGMPDSTGASLHPHVPVTRQLTALPPGVDALTLTATTWEGTTYTTSLPLASGADPEAVRTAAVPIPPVPAAVWIVIGGFVLITLGIVAVWLVAAQRTAAQRQEAEAARETHGEARPVAVSAELPTPG